MIRSLGAWILDQAFEVVGIIAEAQQRRTIRRHTEQAHRQALLEATDAHMRERSKRCKRCARGATVSRNRID